VQNGSTNPGQTLKPSSASRVPQSERRRSRRQPCTLAVTLRPTGQAFPLYAETSDLGAHGFYVKTVSPPIRGCGVGIQLAIEGTSIRARGVVRTSHAGVGAGIEFAEIDAEAQAVIARYIEKLQQAEKQKHSTRLLMPAHR
jgi:hypothetical protein